MVPMWFWLTFVILAVVVGTIVGREERPHCIGCGRTLPPNEWRLTCHNDPTCPPLCLDCYGKTFR